jgi:Putative peptidoglycan binding domain
MLSTVMKSTTAAVTAISLSLASVAPAQALNDDQEKLLKGLAAALIIGTIVKQSQARPPVVLEDDPRYIRPNEQPVYSSSIYQTPAAQAFNSYGVGERKAIQQKLANYGYYRSGIDATFGPGTYNAVVAYARDTNNTNLLGTRNGAFGVYDSLIY